MLSYQHHYHAGSLSDIHKHTALLNLLQNLTRKERPISYMETHSGRGFYDTASPEALKTGEAAEGINKLLGSNSVSEEDSYINLINKLKVEFGNPNFYPGSPLIAKKILRPQDELFLMELHPEEIKHLYKLRNLRSGAKTHIHHRDGYEGVLALSPPKNRRGLVLIDPSYEVKTEYDQVVDFCIKLNKKWPEAVIMIWYPILKQGYHEGMKKGLNDYFQISSSNNIMIDDYSTDEPIAENIMLEKNKTFTTKSDANSRPLERKNTPLIVYNEYIFRSPIRALGSGVAIVNEPWK